MIAGHQTMIGPSPATDEPPWDWDYARNLTLRLRIAGGLSPQIPSVTKLSLPTGATLRRFYFPIPGRRATMAGTFSFNSSTTACELCLWDVETGTLERTGIVFATNSSYPERIYAVPLQSGDYLFYADNGKKAVIVGPDFSKKLETTLSSMPSNASRFAALVDGRIVGGVNEKSSSCIIGTNPLAYEIGFTTGGNKIAYTATPEGGFVTTNYFGDVNVFDSNATSIRSGTGARFFGFRLLMHPASHPREVFFGLSGNSVASRVGYNIDTGVFRTTTTGSATDNSAGLPCWLPSGEAFVPEVYNERTGANRFSLYDYASDTYTPSVHSLAGTSAKYFSAMVLPCGKVFSRAGSTDFLVFDFGYSLSDPLPGSLFTSPFGFNQNRGSC